MHICMTQLSYGRFCLYGVLSFCTLLGRRATANYITYIFHIKLEASCPVMLVMKTSTSAGSSHMGEFICVVMKKLPYLHTSRVAKSPP